MNEIKPPDTPFDPKHPEKFMAAQKKVRMCGVGVPMAGRDLRRLAGQARAHVRALEEQINKQ
jgi:hypothetical protein